MGPYLYYHIFLNKYDLLVYKLSFSYWILEVYYPISKIKCLLLVQYKNNLTPRKDLWQIIIIQEKNILIIQKRVW